MDDAAARIDRIEVLPLRVPLDHVYSGSHYSMRNRATIVTRVYAEGLVGECYNGDTDDAFSNSNSLNQTVNGAAADFTFSASPSSRTITRGTGTMYTATITPANGFTGKVSLSVSGLPSRASGSFNPSSVTITSTTKGSVNSTLAISTSSRTPRGTYTLTVKGTSGALSHTTTVQLTVN